MRLASALALGLLLAASSVNAASAEIYYPPNPVAPVSAEIVGGTEAGTFTVILTVRDTVVLDMIRSVPPSPIFPPNPV